jgi:hypothetical protein
MANGEVDILARNVDALVARGYAEVDLRMALGEPAKPTDEPLRREIRRDADREHTRALSLRQALGAERDLVERVADYSEIFAPRLGDDEPLAPRLKSLSPSSISSALTCWLTAPGVTKSSSAARVKLLFRAAASKTFTALSERRRRGIRPSIRKVPESESQSGVRIDKLLSFA